MIRAVSVPDPENPEKTLNVSIFSVASGDSHRVTSLAIARSLDSDMKNMSGSSKRPPELGDTACQS